MHSKFYWKMLSEFIRLRFREKKEVIVLDVPLLYETKILEWIWYPIIVVNVNDENIVKRRLMSRNSLTEQQALDRIHAQMPLKLKCEKADIVVDNSGNFDNLKNEFVNNTIKQIVGCLKSKE